MEMKLLTPGPVSVSRTTREAMMVERASGDADFVADVSYVRDYLVSLVGGGNDYTAIPVPGSATYANEAAIASLVKPGRSLLIHSNGVYGDRLVEICQALGIPAVVLRTEPFVAPQTAQFEALITPEISHVMLVHCETSTGILNPLEGIAQLCRERGLGLLIDAVASYGAIPIDAAALGADAITLSSNKCMGGVPGIGWAVMRRAAMEEGARPAVLSLDLLDQDRHIAKTGTFRFTPPMQVLAAFAQACREHEAEGGCPARRAKFEANWRRLVDGMRQMGFQTVVPDTHASPIVATFLNPEHPRYSFSALFEGMKRRGFVIFPGRLALANTFRIACMGDISVEDMGRAMDAVAETIAEMGIHDMGRETLEVGSA
jgi:2-aminoethylphosphonate-pyruvate transaminase